MTKKHGSIILYTYPSYQKVGPLEAIEQKKTLDYTVCPVIKHNY